LSDLPEKRKRGLSRVGASKAGSIRKTSNEIKKDTICTKKEKNGPKEKTSKVNEATREERRVKKIIMG